MAGRLNRRLFLQHDALVCALLFSVNIALNTRNMSIAPLWSASQMHMRFTLVTLAGASLQLVFLLFGALGFSIFRRLVLRFSLLLLLLLLLFGELGRLCLSRRV